MRQGKAWGWNRPIISNSFIILNDIYVKPGGYCSKHVHNFRNNIFFVLKGTLEISIWKNDYELVDKTKLKKFQTTVVKPKEYHQFFSDTGCRALELYYLDGIKKNDIIRESVGGIK
jgi:mannose-6-phosphate isomerase-like protein (cupin superfamily)